MTDVGKQPLFISALPDEESWLTHAAYDVLLNGETLFSIIEGWEKHLPRKDFPALHRWRLQALVDLLRSDELLPQPLQDALANALDGKGDPTVRLVRANGSRRAPTFHAEVTILRREDHPPMNARLALADALDPKANSPVRLVEKRMGCAGGGRRPRASKRLERNRIATELLSAQEMKIAAARAEGVSNFYEEALEISIEEINERAGRFILNESDARRRLADARANYDLSEAVGHAMRDPCKSIEEIAAMIRAPAKRKRGPRSAAKGRAV